jgi:hypothetical protein
MTTKPDFKFGDRVIHIGERQKRGVVSRVFRSGGVWWLAFEGEPDWRYSPRFQASGLRRHSGPPIIAAPACRRWRLAYEPAPRHAGLSAA